MLEEYDQIEATIETIALDLMTLDSEDIPTLGTILKRILELKELSESSDHDCFFKLLLGLKGYIEKIILRETKDVRPFEIGIEALQKMHHCIQRKVPFKDDISALLAELGVEIPVNEENKTTNSSPFSKKPNDTEIIADDDGDPPMESNSDQVNSINLDEEDYEIYSGFVMESQENLAAVEISLIELEQTPDDQESINSIFRAFHTIKGVSGFLNLMQINKLSHHAENLLDHVRSGEISIDETIIDIILESVDILKKYIQGVATGIKNNSHLDVDIDISPLIQGIDSVLTQNEQPIAKPLGEILVDRGDISPQQLKQGLEKQIQEPGKKIGQILVEKQNVTPDKIASALNVQKKFTLNQTSIQVKVDTQKLDNLVDLTGELVIAQTMLRQNLNALALKDQKLNQSLGQLNQITTNLQNTAMSMRMVPIKATFQKMLRLVRELSKSTGKQARLTMVGEDTEIDRNVVDELYEPMVHMIRNSIDHGIELPQDRQAAGKHPIGEISLKAYHKSGRIVVEIRDDGQGLDTSRIIEKAKLNGLISEEDVLSDAEINNLIFQPGFSTAQKVTDISGRGVGMDVVKKNIEKLKGRVEIKSQYGLGSTFLISLPLTLAILEGMLVRVGTERYVIPALSVLESFRPREEDYSTLEGKGEMILSRGRLLPLVRLNQVFNLKNDDVNPWEALVVVAEYENHQIGLLLDELLGKEEVVIKSLGETFNMIDGIAGGAILGDGRVGLILDMAGIWKLVSS